jgi:hypothetical protein
MGCIAAVYSSSLLLLLLLLLVVVVVARAAQQALGEHGAAKPANHQAASRLPPASQE